MNLPIASVRKNLILVFLLFLFVYLIGFFSASYYWQEQVTAQRQVPIYSVQVEEKKVAITLDGVWGADLTPQLLDLFFEYDITITFFFGGFWLQEYPQVAQEIFLAGHELGNHSMTHPHLTQLSAQEIREELLATQELLLEITGEKPRYFRPPFGDYNNQVLEVAAELGYQTIQWSIDSLDWRNPGPDFITCRILDQISPGDIILMHNNAPDTPAALKELIPALLEEGYDIVPLSQLVWEKDYTIDSHSGIQRPLIPEEGENG